MSVLRCDTRRSIELGMFVKFRKATGVPRVLGCFGVFMMLSRKPFEGWSSLVQRKHFGDSSPPKPPQASPKKHRMSCFPMQKEIKTIEYRNPENNLEGSFDP